MHPRHVRWRLVGSALLRGPPVRLTKAHRPPATTPALPPQVNLPDDAIVWLAEQPYQLVQYHFHCPSEHTIGGRHAAVEAHLVHKHLETGGPPALPALPRLELHGCDGAALWCLLAAGRLAAFLRRPKRGLHMLCSTLRAHPPQASCWC